MCAARESLAPTLPTPGSLIRCCIPPRTADGVDARRDGHGHVHPRQTRDTARPRRQDDTHPSTHPPPREIDTHHSISQSSTPHTLFSRHSLRSSHTLSHETSAGLPRSRSNRHSGQRDTRYTAHARHCPSAVADTQGNTSACAHITYTHRRRPLSQPRHHPPFPSVCPIRTQSAFSAPRVGGGRCRRGRCA